MKTRLASRRSRAASSRSSRSDEWRTASRRAREPLRLVIPVKYGIKNIKRIGTIRFTGRRPADYWAEQGYDWYAGH